MGFNKKRQSFTVEYKNKRRLSPKSKFVVASCLDAEQPESDNKYSFFGPMFENQFREAVSHVNELFDGTPINDFIDDTVMTKSNDDFDAIPKRIGKILPVVNEKINDDYQKVKTTLRPRGRPRLHRPAPIIVTPVAEHDYQPVRNVELSKPHPIIVYHNDDQMHRPTTEPVANQRLSDIQTKWVFGVSGKRLGDRWRTRMRAA